MTAPAWSDWRAWPGGAPLAPAVLAETLDGGQAFRWRETEPGVWTGAFDRHLVRLTLDASSRLAWSAPAAHAEAAGAALTHYLDANRDPRELADALPWRSDAHLARCLAEFPGLRILRQPFGETLLGFLCSATKQIVQIRQMVALLAEHHGRPLPAAGLDGRPPGEVPTRRLPTWAELAAVPEDRLRLCQLGFRARFIHQTAQFLARQPDWLEETAALPYVAAKERLRTLPGVGEKIADCVLLFGAGRLEAFPVDTWILQAMAARYGLLGWKPAQVAHFGRIHFGPLAGLAQQYLFAWERKHARA